MTNRKTIIELGCKFSGVATETALELTTGGAFLGLLGKFAGATVESVLNDFAERTLSHREQYRVGGALFFASNKLQERIGNGDILRKDDRFFANNENYRSSSEEILEGVMTKSKVEYEELKIKYISYIYANAAFSEYMVEELNLYLRIAENLTYRQLCIISCIKNQTIDLRKTDIDNCSIEQIAILQEMNNLSQQGIIEMYAPESDDNGFAAGGIFRVSQRGEFQPIYSWEDIVPGRLALTELGEAVYSIMGLEEIAKIDIEKKLNCVKN